MTTILLALLLVTGGDAEGLYLDAPTNACLPLSGGELAWVNINGTATAYGDPTTITATRYGVFGTTNTADAAAGWMQVSGFNAAPIGTSAASAGGPLVLSGGEGSHRIAVTAAGMTGDTIIATVDTFTYTCTENGTTTGTNFDCQGETNADCATNIASCVNTNVAGYRATANSPTSGTVYVFRDEREIGTDGFSAAWLAMDTSDRTNAVITEGIHGYVYVNGQLATSPPYMYNTTTESPSFLDNAHTIGITSGQTVATWRKARFFAPTINGVAGGSAETCTTCATMWIEGAPSGSNISFTNGPYALWVDGGLSRFDGSVISENAAGWQLTSGAPSDTVPVIINQRSSPNTGIGASGANRIDLISNNNGMMIVTTNSIIATATAATYSIRGNLNNDTASTPLNVTDDIQQDGMTAQGTSAITVAAAAATWVATRNWQTVDCDGGGNTITTITRSTGLSGNGIYCAKFVDASCTINDAADGAANTIDLVSNFTSADDAVLCMMHNGTAWHEVSRAAN